MILPEKTKDGQHKLVSRRERRPQIIKLEKRRRKLLHKLKGVNLEVEFNNFYSHLFWKLCLDRDL